METIKTYLENMFMHLPDTHEVSKAKAELLSMMEDKYNELKSEGKSENEAVGIVISEFGNLEELASTLGLQQYITGEVPSATKKVSLDDAKRYIDICNKSGIRTALGVMLCILCPVPLLILGGLTEIGTYNENILGTIGIVLLLAIIAIAVAIFIMNDSFTENFKYIKKEPVHLDYQTQQFVKKEQEVTKTTNTLYMTIGVMLYIISVIPVIILGIMTSVNGFTGACAVVLTLILVSIATFLCIVADERKESYQSLLGEGKFANKSKTKTLNDKVQAIYWPIITCIYLGYSFWTFDWGRSWIIWPVAGVLSGAISAICNLVDKKAE